ncbi:structural maintenance of chromosomes protein 5 [Chloropicon primus]|uniref:Structural maintenance of chromosomes protein 5 n=2 Tax=Chloropicon primus TaxID=1764295 RepID=A0A5B8MVA9_9CHLO|nr:structural maintenance of chromosomes protein 5 [Chloropicon primus]|eukprot:QDZ24513.1 structural maintenance of chromosomes protein 5 [Chloropicon primus]
MTYTDCWFSPGPNLNLILGPNGSGKSTIVCALCIGFAASSKVLGRADNVKDFVKRGEQSGWVEIHIQENENKTMSIRRTLMKASNSSTWLVNGSRATLTEVQKHVKRLNVQIENLCQFLPQDKVVSFAKLSPEELLKETEKAISTESCGTGSLYDKHCELERFHSDSERLTRYIQTYKTKLGNLLAQKNELERDVDKVKQKQKVEEDKAWAEKKMKWVIYDDVKAKYLECKEAFAKAKDMHKKKAGALATTEKKVKKLEQVEKKLSEKAGASVKEVRALNESLAKGQQKVDDGFRATEGIEDQISTFAEEKAQHETKVSDLERDLEDLARELEVWQDKEKSGQSTFTGQHQERLSEIKTQVQGYHEEHSQHRQKLNKIKRVKDKVSVTLGYIEEKLSSFTDSTTQRIEAAGRLNPSVKVLGARRWIEENQNRFRGRVYGPLAAEVQVAHDQHAVYLENQVPQYVWQSFVASYSDDRDILQMELNKKRRMGVTVLYTPQSGPLSHPHGDADRYKNLDVAHTMDETFEAPMVVKNVLKDMAGINMAYIGTAYTQRQIEQAGQRGERPAWRGTPISNLWTPETRYMKTKSRYDGHESLRTNAVRPSRLLVQGGGQGDQAQERADLQREKDQQMKELGSIEREIEELESKLAELDASIDSHDKEKKKLLGLKNQSAKKIKAIKMAQTNKSRILAKLKLKSYTAEEEAELASERVKSVRKTARSAISCVKAFSVLADKHFASVPLHMEQEVAQENIMADRITLRHHKEEANVAALTVDKVQTLFELDRAKLKKAKEEAEASQKLTDESRSQFDKYPSKKEELEEVIIKLQSKINALAISDPNILEEYEQVTKAIDEVQATLLSNEEDYNNFETNLRKKEEAWLNPLQDVVKRVNEKFTSLFADLGFVGEVRLKPSGEGYHKYRLEIHVKFHDKDNLQILTSTVQSGGERSVSTIIYLIALQQLTPCPFRVIDEINQGMDPTNERLVFKKLVEEACIPGSPQCFLLTPKLLPSLHYSDEVTVVNIFNGPFMSLERELRFI